MEICGITKKMIPPEDAGRCNNGAGCDNCPHNEDEPEEKQFTNKYENIKLSICTINKRLESIESKCSCKVNWKKLVEKSLHDMSKENAESFNNFDLRIDRLECLAHKKDDDDLEKRVDDIIKSLNTTNAYSYTRGICNKCKSICKATHTRHACTLFEKKEEKSQNPYDYTDEADPQSDGEQQKIMLNRKVARDYAVGLITPSDMQDIIRKALKE